MSLVLLPVFGPFHHAIELYSRLCGQIEVKYAVMAFLNLSFYFFNSFPIMPNIPFKNKGAPGNQEFPKLLTTSLSVNSLA